MATANPAQKSGNKYGDLKRRLWFLLGALVVYRVGTHIPVPGINASVLDELFRGQQGGILGLLNVFSGGALSRFSIFALGIMTNSLFTHEAIKTTLPKAKELRRVAEPLITLGKTPTLANRRLAFDRLRDRDVVTKLFNELGPRFKARPGGYLRILKFGFRQGDAAPMALIELVDRPAATTDGAEQAA